ncbi:hypothetical protein C7H19_18305 [Aphanothece hegewaldii CCALA 016]|uniref:ParB-like N-terminal domain-containing protein n=1 Tax=Aphanothece hegewaldii CCALA 016 TaxID=2107694 RepID=A0A2T1LU32_9CHRO|nr:ParB/RepB/Spo0J family partition protein [Aphanothece hegewaldii]PSF34958.1 hypothetical protein C7H19_18305 [Aphanothece hegewaldii CCALA 016]
MSTRRNALKDFIYQDQVEEKKETELTELKIEQLMSWSGQPRKYFPPEHIASLARSITLRGLDYPLTVRPSSSKKGFYEVIKGECRYRSAQLAGLTTINVRVKDLTDEEALDEALDENLNRKDLNPIEELDGLLKRIAFRTKISLEEVQSLLYEMKNSWEKMDQSDRENVFPNTPIYSTVIDIFSSHGRDWYSFTCSRLKLSSIPIELYQAISEGKIEYTKGLKLKAITDPLDRKELLEQAIAESWSYREIVEQVKEWQKTQITDTETVVTPKRRMKILSDRLLRVKERKNPELQKQLEKKISQIEKWLDEIEQL